MEWDPTRDYESGLDRGVFYLSDRPGEPWNGLVSVKENPSGADEQTRYIDGVKTHFRRRVGEFSGSIEAFTYPESFYEDVLSQRRPKNFGLSYRISSLKGSKIHLVYNVLISPVGISYKQMETETFQWDFTTLPIPVPGARRSSHLVIDTTKAYPSTVTNLENILYGSDVETSRLPLPEEVLNIFELNSIVRVIDNGDGTFSVTGPDDVIQMLDSTTFQIDWPSVVYIDEATYTISSL